MPLPYDTSCEAEYADGYIHSETDRADISPFVQDKNTFYDILEKLPEADHGEMVRFSVFYKNQRHDVDWVGLPKNARPIRFRDGQNVRNLATGESFFSWVGCRFGYQYNDKTGKNIQEVHEL